MHAKLRGGVLPWGRWFSRLRDVIRALVHANLPQSGQIHMNGVGGDKGFWVVEQYEGDGPYTEVSGARTLRGVGHRLRMITILIHIHVRST